MIYIKTDYKKIFIHSLLILECLFSSAIQAAAADGEIAVDDADRIARFVTSFDIDIIWNLVVPSMRYDFTDMLRNKNRGGMECVLRSASAPHNADKMHLICIAMNLALRPTRTTLTPHPSAREIVGSLLKLGLDPSMDFGGLMPLPSALNSSDMVLAKMLLEAKADIHTKDRYRSFTPLDWALLCSSKEQKLQSVQFLIDAGADGSRYYDLELARCNRYPSSEQSKRDSFYFETLLKMNLDYNRVPENLIQDHPELRRAVNALKERDRDALGSEIGSCVNEPWLIGKGKTSILAGYLGMAES